ncbi:hypothetical protein ACFL2H_11990 [Planctomycetota bacterium]
MVAPIWWCIASVASIAVCELYLSWNDVAWASVLQYVAAASSLCPAISVFGAKRPQDSGWKFIVGSLWLVLILPAIQTMLFGSSDLELHWAWRYFLLFLLIAGWSNYMLTRFWFAACLVAIAQIMMFGKHLPGIPFESDGRLVASGMVTVAVATFIVGWQARTAEPNGIGRVWRDFRNGFGAVWGLRVIERVNSSGEQQSWSRRLMWTGFVPIENSGEPNPDEADQMEQSLRTHLRRFVDSDWIDARMD